MSQRLSLILGLILLIGIGVLAFLTLPFSPDVAPSATSTSQAASSTPIATSSLKEVFVDDDPDNSGIIGIGIDDVGGRVVITKVIKSGPADLAGLKVGDEIATVGERSVLGLSIDEVNELLRGSVNTNAIVGARRPDQTMVMTFTVQRMGIPNPPKKLCSTADDVIRFPLKDLKPLTAVPEFPKELVWKRMPGVEWDVIELVTFFANSSINLGFTELCGEQWRATVENLSREEAEIIENRINEYRSELEQQGWDWNVEDPPFRIHGMAADGMTGGYGGYVKVSNHLVRTIVIGNHNTKTWEPDPDGSGFKVLTAPYGKEFSIYLSDIVSLDQLLPVGK